MSKNEASKMPVPSEVTQSLQPSSEGVRARRAFMMKQFIPSTDFIVKNVVAHGKGTRVTLGRVYGVATGFFIKTNILPDGKQTTSTVLNGMFQAESYLTGELSEAVQVYLPAAYADKVKAIMESDPSIKVVELDCDIGLEATGKPIPYEWVVTAFREGEEMAVLKRLRSSRERPDNAPRLVQDPKKLLAAG